MESLSTNIYINIHFFFFLCWTLFIFASLSASICSSSFCFLPPLPTHSFSPSEAPLLFCITSPSPLFLSPFFSPLQLSTFSPICNGNAMFSVQLISISESSALAGARSLLP